MDKGDIQAAIDAGAELGQKRAFEVNGTPVLVTQEGQEFHELAHLRERPARVEQHARHTTAQSFVEYYNRFADGASAVFLDSAKNEFTAVLDYHGVKDPAWCGHRASFCLRPTPEWAAWKDKNGHKMAQEEFGQFVESHLIEIVAPPNGEMLEVALSLQAKVGVDFSKAIRLDNGQTQFRYVETVEGRAGVEGQLKVPDLFSIGLVLFEGGAPYQVDARFRYRIKDGSLSLWYELVRPHKTLEANVADTRAHIESNMAAGSFYCATL